jgi:hypothetical protein
MHDIEQAHRYIWRLSKYVVDKAWEGMFKFNYIN